MLPHALLPIQQLCRHNLTGFACHVTNPPCETDCGGGAYVTTHIRKCGGQADSCCTILQACGSILTQPAKAARLDPSSSSCTSSYPAAFQQRTLAQALLVAVTSLHG
jgi:hypothetical protein